MKINKQHFLSNPLIKVFSIFFIAGFITFSCSDGGEPTPVPVAEFSASTTTVTIGEEITFTDESTGGATTWFWTFEGGTPTTSTEQNPTLTYENEGTYDVTLIAGSDAGASEPVVKTDFITVNPIPTKEVTIEVTSDSWRRNDFRITDENGGALYFPMANWIDDTDGAWVRDAMAQFDLSGVDVSKVLKAELILSTSAQTKNFLVNNQTISAYHWSYDNWTDDPLDTETPQITGQMVEDEGAVGDTPLGSADYSATINTEWGNEVVLDITDGVIAETDGTLSMLIKFDTQTTASALVGRIMSKEATYLDEAGNTVDGQGPKLVLLLLDN